MACFFVLATAIFIDRLFGQPAKFQPLAGFAKVVSFVDKTWFGQEELLTPKGTQSSQMLEGLVKIKGTLAVFFLTSPVLALTVLADQFYPLSFLFDVFIVYLTIGAHSLKEYSLHIHNSLSQNDIEQAKNELAMLTHQDTKEMNVNQLILENLQAILKNGSNSIIAPMFWFAILGSPGVVLYCLVEMLSSMWDIKNPRYRNFGLAANRFASILNFIPAYLTAISYILVGQIKSGYQFFLKQRTKLGPAVAAGIGSLQIDLNQEPELTYIQRACGLVDRSMIFWLLIIFILGLSHC